MSNKRNGIDVDKLDYFLRDSSSAFGESSPLIHVGRIIASSAVRTTKDGETTVCYEEKMAMDLLDLFRTRMHLHAHLYQHHVCCVVEEMITDALTAAKGVPIVKGSPRPRSNQPTPLLSSMPSSPATGGSAASAASAMVDTVVEGSSGNNCAYDLLEACNDVEAYVNLGDWVRH